MYIKLYYKMYHVQPEKLVRRKKRKYEIGGVPINTTLGEHKIKTVKTKGGRYKNKLVKEKYANVYYGGKNSKCEILNVENPANREFTRKNIITKGAILTVKDGEKTIKVKVVSRPGQCGTINAVPIET